jgi:hypothetical protein
LTIVDAIRDLSVFSGIPALHDEDDEDRDKGDKDEHGDEHDDDDDDDAIPRI